MILVSNDDGIHSEGLRALRDALASLDELVVAGPDRERSAVSLISVTPIHLDLTNHSCSEQLLDMELEWP